MEPATLSVVRGPERGVQYELTSGRNLIGSSDAADIVLCGSGIAPRHCEINLSADEGGERFQLQALLAQEMPKLNGVPTQQAVLRDGDRLSVGEVDLIFRQLPRGQSFQEACSLFYLFRALQSLPFEEQGEVATQISRIAAPSLGGGTLDLFLGGEAAQWSQALEARGREIPGEWLAVLSGEFDAGFKEHGDYCCFVATMPRQQELCMVWERREAAAENLTALAALAGLALETGERMASLELRVAIAEQSAHDEMGILGAAPTTLALKRHVEKLAPRDTTVLIQGESGTGKELVARGLHLLSPRSRYPFVAINCAAIAENLLESELFGHEKGAFTGATELRIGKLEMAAGGVVFLDEIGEMPLPLQAKLLRVLQQRELERVGGRKTIKLDIRLVAATNRDLANEVKQGRFREDLFHRINVITLRTPTLRERREDILLLAHAFLQRRASESGRVIRGFSPEVENALRNYSWPGNIRELENAIERAVVLGDAEEIQLEDLPEALLDSLSQSGTVTPAFHRSQLEAKREAIMSAWSEAGGDYKKAAQTLGIHPNSLLRMIRNLNLRGELK